MDRLRHARTTAFRIGTAATLAAGLASLGDIILLAHGAARELGDSRVDATALVAGHLLGVTCIPLYAAGYWLAARALAGAGRWTALVFPIGIYIGAVGAAVHGVTAVLIETNLHAAGPASPFTIPHAIYLTPLWGVVFAGLILASGLIVAGALGGRSLLPRWAAVVNPAILILALVLVSAPFPKLSAYLAPAAPNLAHLLFFAALTFWLARPGDRNTPVASSDDRSVVP